MKLKWYLAAWACTVVFCHPASATDVEIIAHRGASYDAPENTLESVNLGWAQGADAVEVDVYLSKDGHIVVHHDSIHFISEDPLHRFPYCDAVQFSSIICFFDVQIKVLRAK